MVTDEELALLEKNPETAAVAKKLREDRDKYIPKSRFDEVNDKKKLAEEALAKKLEDEKKATEAKQLEDGKVKELLSTRETELEKIRKEKADLEARTKELEAIKTAHEESQKKLRDAALERIKDADLKKIAEKLPAVEDVVAFADKVAGKVNVHTGKNKAAGAGAGDKPEFKNLAEAETYYREKGLM
jgi:flagellin-like hook-associated protein FlgL